MLVHRPFDLWRDFGWERIFREGRGEIIKGDRDTIVSLERECRTTASKRSGIEMM